MPREDNMFACPVNIAGSDAREMILELQKGYKQRKSEERLYNLEDYIPENIIALYLSYIEKRDFKLIVQNYKKSFIQNEAIVEPGVTPEEREGLGLIYDYIMGYDFSRKEPNIFIEGLTIHGKLYSKCPFPGFGGSLRNDQAVLNDTAYEVPSAQDAKKFFQDFVFKKYDIDVDINGIFKYIDEMIKNTVDLIKYQPFPDGNKRTFRAILNLMFARIGIPPVYIRQEEREVYKNELLKAIIDGDYTGITRFYYYKICDSIVELDVGHVKSKEETDGKRFVIEPKREN